MAKIKLDIRKLPIPEKIARAYSIVAAMQGNANFPTPLPTLTQVLNAVNAFNDAFNEAQAARQTAISKTAAQDEKEEVFHQVMAQLAGYVEVASGGNEAIIMSAGIGVKGAPTPSGAMPAVEGLSAKASDFAGEVKLDWDSVPKAKSYAIQCSVDPPTAQSWQHATIVSAPPASITGLTSGARYWFRVAAVGVQGQGPWSDPATKMAS